MKAKYFLLGLFVIMFSILVLAQDIEYTPVQNVEYPISELGNCGSQKECGAYCDIDEHMEKCLEFAEKNDLMSEEELEEAEKVLPLMVSGETPGNCKTEKECEEYCSKQENIEECVRFAEKAGVISDKEAELVRVSKGEGPGGCRGPQECVDYCGQDENIVECAEFAYNHGIITEKEYQAFKKTKGKGPNGCESSEECDAYCEENRFECLKWALDKDMMTIEEAIEGKSERGKCQIRCFIENDFDPGRCHMTPGKKEMPHETCLLCGQRCRSKEGDKDKPDPRSEEEKCVDECLFEKGVTFKEIIEENVNKEIRMNCMEECGVKKPGEGEKDLDKKKKEMPDDGKEKPEMMDKEPPLEEYDKEGSDGEEVNEEESSTEESTTDENQEEKESSDTEESSSEEESSIELTGETDDSTDSEETSGEEPAETTSEESTESDSTITGEAIKESSGKNPLKIFDCIKNQFLQVFGGVEQALNEIFIN